MLLRLKVSGFKNLVDSEIHFGPFTCIAGANGSGKSNLLDAIRFLQLMTEKPLMEAAREVRGGRSVDVGSLFTYFSEDSTRKISIEADILLPRSGVSHGKLYELAENTIVRYHVEIGRNEGGTRELFLIGEDLMVVCTGVTCGSVNDCNYLDNGIDLDLLKYFIRTDSDEQGRIRISDVSEKTSFSVYNGHFFTLLSVLDSPLDTANSEVRLLILDIKSWKILNLNPDALREPDDFASPTTVGSDGSHVASALYTIASDSGDDSRRVYNRVGVRVSELVQDSLDIWVDRNENREELTLMVRDRTGGELPARALSDGTLRFLVLAVVHEDTRPMGMVGVEEPENGIHPAKIPAMLRLLQGMALDPEFPVEKDNPLRQVIITTHSPAVVQQVPEDSLVFARTSSRSLGPSGKRVDNVRFNGLPGTWRAKLQGTHVPLGQVEEFLNPVPSLEELRAREQEPSEKRVMDREDIARFKEGGK